MIPSNSPQNVCEAVRYLLVSMVAFGGPVVGFPLVVEQKDRFGVEVGVFPSTLQRPLHGFHGLREEDVFTIYTVLASDSFDEGVGVGGRITQDFLVSCLMTLK